MRTTLKEIVDAVESVANEKGIDKEIIFEALEAALASATRKRLGEDMDARVSINRKSGEYEVFRRWKVFADDSRELEFPERELRLEDALDVDPAAEIGGFVEVPLPSETFGRIDAQTAKQVIVQKVREAERAQVVDAYKDRIGTLCSGIVKRVDRNGVYVDLGQNAEGFVPRENLIPREPIRTQDRIKAFLKEVRSDSKLKATPFIMITAESKTENVVAAKAAGVSNYIVKPFNADTLKRKIESVLGALA
jgi:N utilization substance protein A